MTGNEALQRLLAGNRRFAKDQALHPNRDATRRREISQAQTPYAIVLGCADLRVPPEILFDSGLGDLFVVRTAGQVVDGAVRGSLEYGVNVLGIPLLVVLGHTQCGAVQAAIDSIEAQQATETDMEMLVEKIHPAVRIAQEMDGELLDDAVRANVERIANQIKSLAVFAEAIAQGKLQVSGAWYESSSHRDATRRREISQAQTPYAIVLGCADLRVPPEILFDSGLGDLFVVRTAGQVVDGAVRGSSGIWRECPRHPLACGVGAYTMRGSPGCHR